MIDKEPFKLDALIKKYKDGLCEESDFHESIISLIPMVTEENYQPFRIKLQDLESDLEYIDFMVDKENRRTEYLNRIKEIEDYLQGLK